MIMKIRNIWIWIVMASVGYNSCSDMHSLHDKYMQRGEIIYVAASDSVKLYPGEYRVKISYRNYDPKVAKLTVYWDFRQGSAQFDVPADKLGEDVEIVIPDLLEKRYTFELVTSNREGKYLSVPAYISGTVYGKKYASTLANRKISNATVFSNNRMDIAWMNVLDNMVGVEMSYRNSSDEETVLKVPNNEMNTKVTDSKEKVMKYRTLYLPVINCIDTFYTDYTPINFIYAELPLIRYDRTDWEFLEASSTLAGYPGTNILDNNLGTFWHSSDVALPHWFVIDMKTSNRVFRFDVYRTSGNFSDTKSVELYLGNSPDASGSWTKVGEGSFSPTTTGTQEPHIEVITTDNVTEGRYLKMHFLNGRAGANPYVNVTELYLYYQED